MLAIYSKQKHLLVTPIFCKLCCQTLKILASVSVLFWLITKANKVDPIKCSKNAKGKQFTFFVNLIGNNSFL